MKRLLITGASSYLGQYLMPLAVARMETVGTYLTRPIETDIAAFTPLDTRDLDAVNRLVAHFQPDAIIHLAGSNRSPDMTRVIIAGADHISQAAMAVGARLVHVSTDVLFDGSAAPYCETDAPRPIHAYGRAKVAAERAIARHVDHVIVRTSLIFGLSLMDMGTRWVIETIGKGEEVTLFDNQWRNPVWARTLSLALLELVDHDFRGIVNVAGAEALTRADYHVRLLDWWDIGSGDRIRIGPDRSGQFPLDCRLDLRLAQSLLTTPLLGFADVLAQAA